MARFALIMSGGGARGAYEAGVLSYVLDDLPRRLGRPVRFQILTGTSVGAIHACYVAATLGRPHAGRGLIDIWRSLEVRGVYQVGVGDVVGIPLRLLGLAGQRTMPAEGAIPERLTGPASSGSATCRHRRRRPRSPHTARRTTARSPTSPARC